MHFPYKKDLQQNAWVTAIDPEDSTKIKKLKTRFDKVNVKHFVQYFRDWSDEDQESYIKSRLELEGPQERHINNIISFLEPLVQSEKPYNLGVNCMAGMCRSTSIGIIALVMSGKSVEEALEYILKVRPIAWPNLRMLRLASSRLGKNIMTHVMDWKVQQSKKGIIVP